MSYYRMYKSKDDILIQYFNDIFEEYLERIKGYNISGRSQFAVLVFEIVREHHELIREVFRARLYELILKCLVQYCAYLAEHILHKDMESAETGYWIYAEAGRFTLLIYRWLEQGMEDSPEKMAEYLVKDSF